MDRTIVEDDPQAFAAVRQPSPLSPRDQDRPAPDVLATVVLRVVKQREAARAHSEVILSCPRIGPICFRRRKWAARADFDELLSQFILRSECPQFGCSARRAQMRASGSKALVKTLVF